MFSVNFSDPLFWALFIGWVMSVVLHEFAHGAVAYFGGDYTIRERGGLTLNPLQYIDPVMSIALPMLWLCMGGVPLPGGATYIRRDLLRSKGWSTAVSLAGPASNLLIGVGLCIALSPHIGWINPDDSVLMWTPAQKLVGALAFLQLFSVLLNLVPIPPLDGFQAISPYMAEEVQKRLTTGPLPLVLFIGFFFIVCSTDRFLIGALRILEPIPGSFGVSIIDLYRAARQVLYGHP